MTTNAFRHQRGALSVVTPLLLVLVIILAAMALDGARLYSLRGEMQSIVNVAAQAAAGETQTCGGQFVSTALVRQRALAAARAQGFDGEDADLTIQTGLIDDQNDDGVLAFSPVNLIEQSNAVLVSYTRNEPISMLLPQSVFGSLDITVNAAARKQVVATLSAAGATASVDSGIVGGLLGAVLGDPSYILDPTSLDSLRNTTVELGELLTEAGVADVAELLALDGEELAIALRDVAGATSPVGDILDDLLGASGIDTLAVSDVLEVVEGTDVPADSEFPLYDMVISLVLNVAETQQDSLGGFLEVPLDLDLNLPPIATVDASVELNVGEAPRIVTGPARQDENGDWVTRFFAPDISLLVNADVSLLGLGPLLGAAEVALPLAVNVGGADGAFVASRCAQGAANDVEVVVDINRSVARLGTGSIDPDDGTVQPDVARLEVLSLFSIPLLAADLSVAGTVEGVSDTGVVIASDYPLYCGNEGGCSRETYTDTGDGVGDVDLDVNLDNEEVLGGLPVNVGPLLNLLEGLVSEVVEGLATLLINPLLESLGLGLGGVTVTVSSASQNTTQLIENIDVSD